MVLIRPWDLRCSVRLLAAALSWETWISAHNSGTWLFFHFLFKQKHQKVPLSIFSFCTFFHLGPQSHTLKLWSHTYLYKLWQPFVLFGFWQSVNHIYCFHMTATSPGFREIKQRRWSIGWSVSVLYLWQIWWRANTQPATAAARRYFCLMFVAITSRWRR